MGYIQDQIIFIGKEQGFVTSIDVSRFYQPSKVQQEMNKLIVLGYFGKPEDCGAYIKWKYKGK